MFSRQIFTHVETLFISTSDLFSTVAVYFNTSATTAEKETEIDTSSIRDLFVSSIIWLMLVSSTLRGDYDIITGSSNCSSNLSYFIFRSNVSPYLVNSRVPDNFRSFEFTLNLLYTNLPFNSTTLLKGISIQNQLILSYLSRWIILMMLLVAFWITS